MTLAAADLPGPSSAVDPGPGPVPVGLLARLVVLVVRLYQGARAGRPSPCRYLPTCSAYAIEAVTRHGAGRGGWMALRRVGRCHPWGGRGYDPVPE